VHIGAMMARADVHSQAQDDFLNALARDVTDAASLDGLVRAATMTGKAADALARLEAVVEAQPASRSTARVLAAISKLQAASGSRDEALVSARRATEVAKSDPAGYEQLAALFADAGDTVRLDQTVDALQFLAADAPGTLYYAAVAAFLHGDHPLAMMLSERGMGLHPRYAPLYDLAGAAYTKMGQVFRARWAFNQSLAYDAHDSTAYENLGLLALEEGDLAAARNYFAEALWLVPNSRAAREGMRRVGGQPPPG
jgi:Flp pilus assembly protein TadD